MNMCWLVMRGTSHQKFRTQKPSSLSRRDYPHLLKYSQLNLFMHLLHLIRLLSLHCVGRNQRKPKHMPGIWICWWLHPSSRHTGLSFWASIAFPAPFAPQCWVECCLEAMTSPPADIWQNEWTTRVCDFLSTQELRSNDYIWTFLNAFCV